MGTVRLFDAKSTTDFDRILREAGSSLVVVHFYAEWAPQCQQMKAVLEELSKDDKFKQSLFVQIEAERISEVSLKYNISAVPTCVLLKDGVELDRVNGANVPDLTKKVEQLQGTSFSGKKEDLDTRLKELINRAPVMLFMKGDPKEPRCGFSKQIVTILNDQNVQFSTFNILADEEVRQGLKTFSDWPTYPQLYINGELIGGLDILKEMIHSGELEDQLPRKEILDDKLRRLINKDKIMVFMKGSPRTPRCGFSRTVVEMLNNIRVQYSTVDILEDDEVRQGLKTFSNWPTYPQIYVKGELVGGLDILKELQEGGELEATLKAE